jgi:hypothetical protein
MADIYDFGSHRAGEPPQDGPPRTRNQEILDRFLAEQKAATPQARLLNELRAMEETLMGNHRQYERLWEAAEQLGIRPPVRTAGQIVKEIASSWPTPLPPCLSFYRDDAPPEQQPPPAPVDMREYPSVTAALLADPQAFQADSGPSNDHDHGPDRGR